MTQAMIAAVAMWGWVELATRIQSGDVVTDLQRPADVQSMYLAEDLGRAGYQTLARGLPPFVVGALVYHLQLPESLGTWIAFAVSVLLAIIVSFGFRWLVNLMAFWFLDFRGLNALSSLCITLFSGFILPLAFFPSWAERVLTVLPWASMIGIPIDVFLGRRTGIGLLAVLALQAAWAVALLVAGRIVLATATRRVVVQGG
jgi:ABC-2 type transport system permease protein